MSGPSAMRRWDWRTILPIAIFTMTLVVMVVPMIWGTEFLGADRQAWLNRFFASVSDSPYAGLAVMAAFTVLGLTGFPQFLLIGGVAAIFGPWLGFVYSWLATMVSATIGFYLGRASGGTLVRRHGGPKLQRTSEILGERGIFASFIVRLIPSGPAVVVNMIAGASHIRLWQYLLGTGLGIVPKTVFLAFFGGKLANVLKNGNLWELAAAGAALMIWILAGVWVRRRYLAGREKARGRAETPVMPIAKPADDTAGSGQGPVH